MEDRLTGCWSVVGKNVKPIKPEGSNEGLRDGLRCMHNVVQIGIPELQQIAAMIFRNDEGVPVVDRVNVEDCNHLFSFKEDFGRQPSFDDLTKRALHLKCGRMSDGIVRTAGISNV